MSAREFLKAHTQNLHRITDSHALMRSLTRRDLTIPQYRRTLACLSDWLHQVSFSLACLNLPPEQHPERKLSAIKSDLERLGYSRPARQLAHSVPSSSQAFLMGVHYVVEGSTLGAQFIAPRIETSLNRMDVTHYFRCYGDEVLQNWARTEELLEGELKSAEKREEALQGAAFAFQLLILKADSILAAADNTDSLSSTHFDSLGRPDSALGFN